MKYLKAKYLIILTLTSLGITAIAASYVDKKTYIEELVVIGKNGGENGFNNIEANCSVLGKMVYSEIKLEDSGYSNLNFCPPIDMIEDVKPILSLFISKIESNESIDTTYTFLDYKVAMNVKDRGNFNLRVLK